MVRPDQEGMRCSLQPMKPLTHGQSNRNEAKVSDESPAEIGETEEALEGLTRVRGGLVCDSLYFSRIRLDTAGRNYMNREWNHFGMEFALLCLDIKLVLE